MLRVAIIAQGEVDLPTPAGDEFGTWLVWLLLGAGIVALFVVINRTRKRSYRHYMDKTSREAEMKANDPDMKQPEE